jgi:hypothetical protein
MLHHVHPEQHIVVDPEAALRRDRHHAEAGEEAGAPPPRPGPGRVTPAHPPHPHPYRAAVATSAKDTRGENCHLLTATCQVSAASPFGNATGTAPVTTPHRTGVRCSCRTIPALLGAERRPSTTATSGYSRDAPG